MRKNIAAIEGYTPGFQPKGDDYVKLNTNENPYPPSPRVCKAVDHACQSVLLRYPSPAADNVRDVITEVFGFPHDRIICGNGSDDLLNMALRTFCDEGDVVAFPRPTYSLYETLAAIQGARAVTVEFPDDYSMPWGLADTDAKLVIVPNPNAPTGTLIPPADLEALAGRIDGVLLIDEAYADFADANCLELVDRCPNVIVTRSLSKSYSLAGLRFGFALAQEPLIAGLMKVKDSYNVGALPSAGAAAALADQAWMRANTAKVRATRRRLAEALSDLGFYCLPSQANFILARVPDGHNAAKVFDQLFERHILVRYFDQPRVDDCLRITVGDDEQVDALLRALQELLRR